MTNKKFTLQAQVRSTETSNNSGLRQTGQIPAILYGHKIKNQNLILKQNEFERILEKAGESSLIDLEINKSEPVKVLIQDIQHHPVAHKIIHVDLYQVNMKEKIHTEVELNFINESPAVKNLGGVLVKALDSIEIECLPGDLISHIDVDLSKLKQIDDILRVKDLSLSENISILTEFETPMVLVEEPKKIEEELPSTEETSQEGAEGEEIPEGEEKSAEGEEEKKPEATAENS